MSEPINPENKCSHLINEECQIPTIQEMFNMQKALQEHLASKGRAADIHSHPSERLKDISVQWRNLTLEFAELLERLPYKEWKTYTSDDWHNAFSDENFLETKFEYIDMWHFFMNIGLLLGINGDEFSKLYYLKNKENFARQERGY